MATPPTPIQTYKMLVSQNFWILIFFYFSISSRICVACHACCFMPKHISEKIGVLFLWPSKACNQLLKCQYHLPHIPRKVYPWLYFLVLNWWPEHKGHRMSILLQILSLCPAHWILKFSIIFLDFPTRCFLFLNFTALL